ncbi:hypothetical protein [Clostridium pasteurianum]|uniref:Uncharacterized protein n=1 Tax=Clostridium pasteurianum BC1 TaxID=86416 RepID=R4KCB6_CLOPA|nr:hypothetical protein [Clostridium pasteurianum]AGK98169.1 hypothetical protein Clopa_3373 [Clostridium pasteurianum BC1]
MIEDYFNSNVVWKKSTGTNAYDEKTYENIDTPCLKIDKIRLTRNKLGEQVSSTSTIRMKNEPGYDDMLDDRTIITINSMNGLDGIEGYEVLI